MRLLAVQVLVLASHAAGIACYDHGPAWESYEVYRLASVRGEEVPMTWWESEQCHYQLLGGELRIYDDRTFLMEVYDPETRDCVVDMSGLLLDGVGKWTRSKDTYSFDLFGEQAYTGTVAGSTLTIVNDGISWVFEFKERVED